MRPMPCIWISKPRKQRLTHVYFRRKFTLGRTPNKAPFSLYAQTNYHLKVNGTMVGYGPARSFNDFPEYDTYDIAPYLKKGTNVVAVQVSHDGAGTFHHANQKGLLVAWGTVADGAGKRVSLSTESGWLCHRSRAHEPNPLPFSFAIGPIPLFDERKAPRGWDMPGTPAGTWEKPARVPEALEGTLRPRSIPHLTQEERLPLRLLGAWAHDMSEQIYSFAAADPSAFNGHRQPSRYTFAYAWIHSPRRQNVTVANWWGDPALNGTLLKRTPCEDRPGREHMVLALRRGWNFFAIYYRSVNGIWDFHLGVPRSAKLTIAPRRSRSRAPAMMVAGPMDAQSVEKVVARWPRIREEQLAAALGTFRETPLARGPLTPSRGLAWAAFARPIAAEDNGQRDVTIPARTDVSAVYDMGAITLGRIFVEFEAPRGTVVDVAWAEEPHGQRPHIYKNVMVHAGERHVAAGGVSRMESFAPRGFRYLQVGVHGHAAPVRILRVGAVSQVYPYVKRGSFECSDPVFNVLWAYGWNTLRLCSEDVITDCPWRERTLYGGDLLPEAATAAVTSGDLRLVKRCLEVFLQSASPETGALQARAPASRREGTLYDYPLIVLLIAEWYCRLSGDRAFARRCAPVFRRMLATVMTTREKSGLFVANQHVFIMHGYRTNRGRLCALNALVARSFAAWANLLDLLGKGREAGEARAVSETTEAATVRRFWDTTANAFTDALPPDNPDNHRTVPANAWPLLFCRVPGAKQKGAIAEIARRLAHHNPENEPESISTYGSFYMLGALYATGTVALAEESMRKVYRRMIEHPTGTIWEHSNAGKSLTHAWSTAPNYYLSTRVLGVRLGFPEPDDLSEVLIAPESETLSWAKGVVPHPRGDIAVEWRVTGRRLALRYSAPRGVRVKVEPRGRLSKLRLHIVC